MKATFKVNNLLFSKQGVNKVFNFCYELAGLIILPIVVYAVTLGIIGTTFKEFSELPEWGMLSIVLIGDNTRKLLTDVKYRQDTDRVSRIIGFAILYIVISCIFIIFSILKSKHAISIVPEWFGYAQIGLFIFIIVDYARKRMDL